MTPSYISLHRSGELQRRAEAARAMQSPCRLCPRRCGARRADGERGMCRSGTEAVVYRAAPHFGEEPAISGTAGSGAVFFGGCPLACVYCQNYRFSRGGEGVPVSVARLADIFRSLEKKGYHNLNLVTATQYLPQVLSALGAAAAGGFSLPVVFNTSGYETLDTLRLLDGVVDVYLADMRYWSPAAAERYSEARDYPSVNWAALREMWRQAGPLRIGPDGIAVRGLVVRHLVLPHGLSGTDGAMSFLAREISPNVAVSLMSQYTPCDGARGDPLLGRRISAGEYEAARESMEECGIRNGWTQEWTPGPDDGRLLGERMESNLAR